MSILGHPPKYLFFLQQQEPLVIYQEFINNHNQTKKGQILQNACKVTCKEMHSA